MCSVLMHSGGALVHWCFCLLAGACLNLWWPTVYTETSCVLQVRNLLKTLTRLSTDSFIGFLKYFPLTLDNVQQYEERSLWLFIKCLVPGVSSYFRTVPEPFWEKPPVIDWLLRHALFSRQWCCWTLLSNDFAVHQDAMPPVCISDATRRTCSSGDSSYNYSYCTVDSQERLKSSANKLH